VEAEMVALRATAMSYFHPCLEIPEMRYVHHNNLEAEQARFWGIF
jgi:hypothetical protein